MASLNKFKDSKNAEKLHEELEIPGGINVVVEGNEIIIKKDDKEIKRIINNRINVKVEGDKVIIDCKKITKREKKILFTTKAHIKNAFEGLTKAFKYKLQAVSVHFPMTLEIDKSNNVLIIKNFLGEKKPRTIKIIPGVEVKLNKDLIEVDSADIEKAGQVAANIEKGSKIRNRDRRVFQDGIFMTEKPGVVFSL